MPVTKWVLSQEKQDFQMVTMRKHCHLGEAITSLENKFKTLKLTYINRQQ